MRRKSHAGPVARPVKAALIVVAIVLVVPGFDAVLKAGDALAHARESPVGIDAAEVVGFGDPDRALERIESFAQVGETSLPEGFADEIGVLPGARDLRVCGDDVVGYVVDASVGEVYGLLRARMDALGWTMVPEGQEHAATFVKDDGRCTWALVTCEEVGSATSVVIRCVIA